MPICLRDVLCFHASPSLWYLPCPDRQAQGHEKGGEGWMPAVCVCVCCFVHVPLCMCKCVQPATSTPKSTGNWVAHICRSSDNNRPTCLPSMCSLKYWSGDYRNIAFLNLSKLNYYSCKVRHLFFFKSRSHSCLNSAVKHNNMMQSVLITNSVLLIHMCRPILACELLSLYGLS